MAFHTASCTYQSITPRHHAAGNASASLHNLAFVDVNRQSSIEGPQNYNH